MNLNITASELYSIAPDYLSHVHKSTKTRLVLPSEEPLQLKVNQIQLKEVGISEDSSDDDGDEQNETNPMVQSFNALIKQNDPTISQPLIEFDVTLNNKIIKARYDPGSTSSLINRDTAIELGLKIEPYKATVVGINPGELSIKGLISTTLEINCHQLEITILVHESMEKNIILIGRAFQMSHCFSIGYFDISQNQKMVFKSEGRLHNFKMFNDEVVVQDRVLSFKWKALCLCLLTFPWTGIG